MSFMYKAMMSRAPNKRKIKINEENILRLITNSEEEDEEDEDFTVSNSKDKEKNDDGNDSCTDTEESESECQDSDANNIQSEIEQPVRKASDKPRLSSNRRKQTRRLRKASACPTIKELEADISSEYYGLPTSTVEMLTQAKKQYKNTENTVKKMNSWPEHICVVCLNDEREKNHGKMITCQRCATSVHTDCYNMQLSVKNESYEEIWICDSCVYGGNDVVCQFCPNLWGCMKETKCGRWCHIVCARNIVADFLYNMPNTSRNSQSTIYIKLDECSNKGFGSKECILCEDRLVAKTGICIKCDAGLCKSTFHVTCAQRHGLLSKVTGIGDGNNNNTSGETYYANCPLHSDKELLKRRQKNFILQHKTSKLKRLKYEERNFPQQNVVSAKIAELRQAKKRQTDYFTPPRPPLEQMPRLLSSDAHFTRLLNDKAEKMFGISTRCPATIIPKATEVRKKHYVAPSLTTDFSAYFADRQLRIEEEKTELDSAIKSNRELSEKQKWERHKYNELRNDFIEQKSVRSSMKSNIENLKQLFSSVFEIASNMEHSKTGSRKRKSITPRKIIASKTHLPPSPPTQELVGTSSNDKEDATSLSSSPSMSPTTSKSIPDAESIIELKCCGICGGQENQHLLARCDVCKEWQHLACLDPPLSQMPKRTKFSLWQCSECADTSGSSSSDCDTDNHGSFMNQDGRRLTRRLRRVPDKLAVGFPDDTSTLKTKRSIGHAKMLFKSKRRLKEALKDISKKESFNEISYTNKETVNDSQKSKSSSEKPTSSTLQNKTSPMLRFGVSCDNYLSHAARIPILNLPIQAPVQQIVRQPQKIIFLKRAKVMPNRPRPLGLGKIRKLTKPVKKVELSPKSQIADFKEAIPRRMRLCHVCQNSDNDVHIVTCDTCKNHYHWKCCDPPLKINPVTKYAAWECSACVDEKDEEKEETVDEDNKDDTECSVTPGGRRIINRKRKPPEVFEPAFNVSDQRKIFNSITKKKIQKIIISPGYNKSKTTAPPTNNFTSQSSQIKTNVHHVDSTSAARCIPITSIALTTFTQWSSNTPLKILKPLRRVDLSGLKGISIIKNCSSDNVVGLVPCKSSSTIILPRVTTSDKINLLGGESSSIKKS